tara:strand:+ start:185 stop:385 length:201 start_codon:yes stop_codon:yes gene_type:complete
MGQHDKPPASTTGLSGMRFVANVFTVSGTLGFLSQLANTLVPMKSHKTTLFPHRNPILMNFSKLSS